MLIFGAAVSIPALGRLCFVPPLTGIYVDRLTNILSAACRNQFHREIYWLLLTIPDGLQAGMVYNRINKEIALKPMTAEERLELPIFSK